MTTQHEQDAPRQPRGASSWARRINDGTGEWLTALLRVWAVVWALVAVGALFGLIWQPGLDWALTAVLAGLLAASHVWAGFVWLANPEWKETPDDDA